MVCSQLIYLFRLASFSLSLQALLANVPVRTFVELSHLTPETNQLLIMATTMELTMETTMVPMVPTMERTTRIMVMEQLHIMRIMELLPTILFNTLLFRQAQSSTTLSTGKLSDMILL